MNTNFLRVCVVVSGFLFLTAPGSAQIAEQIITDSSGRKIILKTDKTWDFVVEKSATAVSKGKKIVGDDAKQIAGILSTIKDKLAKSEFETEQAYRERLRLLLQNTSNPASGKSLAETVIIFQGLDIYDAEEEIFSFSFSGFYFIHRMNKSTPPLSLVTRDSGYWRTLRRGHSDSLELKMPAATAQLIKPDLALAVFGSPVEVDSSGNVSLVPVKFVAFNLKTGEEYQTWSPEGVLLGR